MTAGLDEAGLRDWLVEYLVTNVGCDRDEVDCDASLNDLGVGSRNAMMLSDELAEEEREEGAGGQGQGSAQDPSKRRVPSHIFSSSRSPIRPVGRNSRMAIRSMKAKASV